MPLSNYTLAPVDQLATYLHISPTLILILAIWSIIWKGLALYRAGKNRSVAWFVVLFVINTLGILDILYIFIFSKKSRNKLVEIKIPTN